jgi:hypothetical protein
MSEGGGELSPEKIAEAKLARERYLVSSYGLFGLPTSVEHQKQIEEAKFAASHGETLSPFNLRALLTSKWQLSNRNRYIISYRNYDNADIEVRTPLELPGCK